MTLLQIVFQTGDFYNEDTSSFWSDLLNTTLGAMIGTGATIGAVYLTFKKDRTKEDNKKTEFQIEKIKYFQSLVRNTIKKLKPQIEALNSSHTEINSNPLYIKPLAIQTLYELERLVHKINQEEYYHSYLAQLGASNETIEEFRKIYALLDFFEANIKLIEESFKKSIDFDYKRKLEFKNKAELSMDMAAQMLINPAIKSHVALWNFVNKTILDYYAKAPVNPDIQYLQDNFIDPMKPDLLPFAMAVPEANNLIVELKKATFIYSDIKLQNLELAKDLKMWYNSSLAALGKLETECARLMAYKI